MKNSELYYKSVDILLDAYNEGGLIHQDDCACAVGNLVRANGGDEDAWYIPMLNYKGTNKPDVYIGTLEERTKMTGYDVYEIMEIERAFESERQKDVDHNTQYYGLCAVLDVLRDIHEVENQEHEASHTRLETIYKKLQTA